MTLPRQHRITTIGVSARLACGATLLLACAAHAADLTIEITDTAGKPVADAVVSLTAESPRPADAAAASPPRIIDQRNETFIPLVQVVRRGATAAFRNSDTMRHHVYSFSPAKAFELVTAP